MLAWVPDAEFKLSETDPISILNQLRGTGVCSVGNYWTPQQIDVSGYLKHDRSTSWGGWYTNPTSEILKNEPYWCSPGRLLLVCDGDVAGAVGSLNIAIDVMMTIDFWEPIVRSPNTQGVIRTEIDVSILGDSRPFRINTIGVWEVIAAATLGVELFEQATEIKAQIDKVANLGKLPLTYTATPIAFTRMENFRIPPASVDTPDPTFSYDVIRLSHTGASNGLFLFRNVEQAMADNPQHGSLVPFGFDGLQMLVVTTEANKVNPMLDF